MGLKPESLDDGGGHSLPLRFRAKDVLVLSVAVTETTFARVQTVTHVLVAHVRPRGRDDGTSRLWWLALNGAWLRANHSCAANRGAERDDVYLAADCSCASVKDH